MSRLIRSDAQARRRPSRCPRSTETQTLSCCLTEPDATLHMGIPHRGLPPHASWQRETHGTRRGSYRPGTSPPTSTSVHPRSPPLSMSSKRSTVSPSTASGSRSRTWATTTAWGTCGSRRRSELRTSERRSSRATGSACPPRSSSPCPKSSTAGKDSPSLPFRCCGCRRRSLSSSRAIGGSRLHETSTTWPGSPRPEPSTIHWSAISGSPRPTATSSSTAEASSRSTPRRSWWTEKWPTSTGRTSAT